MQASQTLKNKIMDEEGLVLHPYLDPPHNTRALYSIGYGHQIQPAEKYLMTGITKDKAVQLFNSDLSRFEKTVTASIKRPLNQDQFDALVDLAYNAGDGAEQKVIVTWNTTGNPADTASHIKEYQFVHVNGVPHVDPDLVARRAFEADLFTGVGHAIAGAKLTLKKKAD